MESFGDASTDDGADGAVRSDGRRPIRAPRCRRRCRAARRRGCRATPPRACAPPVIDVRLPYPVDLSMQSLPSPVVQYGVDHVSIKKIALLDHEEQRATWTSRPSTSTWRRRRPRTRTIPAPSWSAPSPSCRRASPCTDPADSDRRRRRRRRAGVRPHAHRRGQSALAAFVKDYKTPFQFIAHTKVVAHGGDPLPVGRPRLLRAADGAVLGPQVERAACYSSRVTTTSSSPARGRPACRRRWRWCGAIRRCAGASSSSTARSFPREKPCGGGLTGHAEEAMARARPRADGAVGAVAARRGALLGLPARGDARAAGARHPARRLRRQPRGAGARPRRRGARGRGAEPASPSTATASTSASAARAGGTLRARVLVGADGVGSRVRKQLNGESDGTPIRLFRLEVPARGAWRSDAMLYDFSPMTDGLRGYLWVFPVAGDRLNVGLMHDPGVARSGGELDALLRRHLERLGITLPRAARGWPAFGYQPSAPIAAPRLLTVGDAAGIDALTGEGIAVGMEQALVAADAIVARARRRATSRFAGYAPRGAPRHRRARAGDRSLAGAAALSRRLAALAVARPLRRAHARALRRARVGLAGARRSQARAGVRAVAPPVPRPRAPPHARRRRRRAAARAARRRRAATA